MKLDELYRWKDTPPASGAEQMALDEALFRFTQENGTGVIRYYQWDRPAVTFGYSEPCPEIDGIAPVRRYTGGGRVDHGDDLTFLLTLPAPSEIAKEDAETRYRWLHEAIQEALEAVGCSVILEGGALPQRPGPCFQHPVSWDLLSREGGHKIGGGAQRRSRGSVIHQGSLRLPREWRENHSFWTGALERRIAQRVEKFPEDRAAAVVAEAESLTASRYGTVEWNRKR